MAGDTGLARLLRQIIADSGESQDALGDRLTGGGRNGIGPWLRGRPPNNESIKKMAPALGLSVPELLILSGQFTEADLHVERLPPDPGALTIPQLLDELRARFAALDPDAPVTRDTPPGALHAHEPDSSQVAETPTGRRRPKLVRNGEAATDAPPPGES